MLSSTEEKVIQDTWALISPDLKKSGVGVFLRFFTDYPNYQKSFRSFANVPFDDLPQNKRFQAHAYTVMNAIDGMVNNLDDPEMLDEMLLRTGVNHGKRKLTGQAFDEFKSSFMGYLETTLKDKWSSETEAAWELVVALIITKIKDGMEAEN
ncbi:Globin [Orchesella cincta]|uniref:Globin n=1 Tax=Orchesella cincta TaxID=48709 RepID=A0A1D2NAV0_ORCCI|nr:Globin [Orchesella cincta]